MDGRRAAVPSRSRGAVQTKGEGVIKNDAASVRRRSRPIISPDEDLAVFMKRKALERKREMKEQQKQKEDAEKKKREALANLEQFTRGQLRGARPKSAQFSKNVIDKNAQKENTQPKLHPHQNIDAPKKKSAMSSKLTTTDSSTNTSDASSRPGSFRTRTVTIQTPVGPKPTTKSNTGAAQKAAPIVASARPRALSTFHNLRAAVGAAKPNGGLPRQAALLLLKKKKARKSPILIPRPRATIISQVVSAYSAGVKPQPMPRRGSMPTTAPSARAIAARKPVPQLKAPPQQHQPQPTTVKQTTTTTTTKVEQKKEKMTSHHRAQQPKAPQPKEAPQQKKAARTTHADTTAKAPSHNTVENKKNNTATKQHQQQSQQPQQAKRKSKVVVAAVEAQKKKRGVSELMDEEVSRMVDEAEKAEREEEEALLWAVIYLQRRFRNKMQRRLQAAPPRNWHTFVRGVTRLQALHRGRALRRKRVEESMKEIVDTILNQVFCICRHRQKTLNNNDIVEVVSEPMLPLLLVEGIKEDLLDPQLGYIKLSIGALCGAFQCLYGPYSEEKEGEVLPRLPLGEAAWADFSQGEGRRKLLSANQRADDNFASFSLRSKVVLSDRLLFDLVNEALADLAVKKQGFRHLAETDSQALSRIVSVQLQGWLGESEHHQALNRLLGQEAVKLTTRKQDNFY